MSTGCRSRTTKRCCSCSTPSWQERPRSQCDHRPQQKRRSNEATRRLTEPQTASRPRRASGGCQPSNVTSLEINLDADQCRVLDLGLHVIKVSPKLAPTSGDLPRDRCAPSRHLESSHFLRRQRFAPTAPPSFARRCSTVSAPATRKPQFAATSSS